MTGSHHHHEHMSEVQYYAVKMAVMSADKRNFQLPLHSHRTPAIYADCRWPRCRSVVRNYNLKAK